MEMLQRDYIPFAVEEDDVVYCSAGILSSLASDDLAVASSPSQPCGAGHRPSLALSTPEGGAICLGCVSSLLSSSSSSRRSPTHHVSYALSQFSLALRSPAFHRALAARHPHLLVAPLVRAIASFDDEPLARQIIDLIADLCRIAPDSVFREFVGRIADLVSSGELAWSRRQFYALHCFGVLLNSHEGGCPTIYIRDKAPLFSNLLVGLQLPSEEIRGEIMFLLYKLLAFKGSPWDEKADDSEFMSTEAAFLVRLSLEALLKTQHDEVRLNCIALLLVLARKGILENSFANDQASIYTEGAPYSMQEDETVLHTPLIHLFADAIKGPLLSCDTEVQISTMDLLSNYLSPAISSFDQIEALIEESIADYIFEVLRLSGNNDPLVISCIQVLDLLSIADDSFQQRLAIGFATLVSVLQYVADVPLHPVQLHVLKLVWSCISNCPGFLSPSQAEEIAQILTGLFKRHTNGELDILLETFTLSCSTFVEILKSLSANQKLTPLVEEASKGAILISLNAQEDSNSMLLYSLYLLKEVHIFCCEESSYLIPDKRELEKIILEICEICLLPWLAKAINIGIEEEAVLGVVEIFHLILLNGSDIHARKFAETLSSSCWFSISFECLGFYPSNLMKARVYLMLSSVIDRAFSPDFGKPIRDAYLDLPSDPLELIFILGLKSSNDLKLLSCQSAVLLILYVCSLFGERLADESQILASLEQYILVNSNNFSCGVADSLMLTQLVHVYGLVRGASIGYRVPYSREAEKSLFHLIIEKEWELLSIGTHPRALKWLFQQEDIMAPLSYQMLNFCRLYSTKKTQLNVHAKNVSIMDIQVVAGLVNAGDNCVALLLVNLLKRAQDEGVEDDTMSVVNVLAGVLKTSPDASDQFCLHGISDAICSVYYSDHSIENFGSTSLLVFNILYLANSEALTHDGKWHAITMKLLQLLSKKLGAQTISHQTYLIMGIFSLILHHSSNQVLKEASKAILLNASLASATKNIVQVACTKGPALVNHNEETSVGESLISVLLLYFYSLKSLHANLQETVDWLAFLENSKEDEPLSVICIGCHDLCRLIHFGSSSVKLVASQCLVELLVRISDQTSRKGSELKCTARYLESIMAVTEALVFYPDNIVATNCSVCFSIILRWEKVGLLEKGLIRGSKWCRLVIEELVLTLASPGLASRSFTNQHKPAAHIAVALLRMDKTPEWMRSVFSSSCISGIIDNLSACNVSAEMVMLFQELMRREYLTEEHVSCLHSLFQVCRKHVYKDSFKAQIVKVYDEELVNGPDDMGGMRRLLFKLMCAESVDFKEIQTDHTRLLEEIETFLKWVPA